jgi:protein-tyrosine phosphatase/membrane-associated phospholipid phosphatase
MTAPTHTAEPHPWRRALAWLLFLAPFFFITYGLANLAAAQRADVPSLVFGWEHGLPFWAWTIVPYWSIDALYGLSLFVCTSRRELDSHGKRLLTAQLVAVAFFVAIPHRFSFERPVADGLFGAMFDLLMGFDRPFNQIPSLHIALAVILWALYARKVTGLARILLDVWFVLIGASVLTTYQHHFIDIPTGLILGWLCVWLWPFTDDGVDEPVSAWRWTTDPARHRLAIFYVLGALACLAIGLAIGGWGLWLAWPALSLALVAMCYAGPGAGGFQKGDDGRLSVAARWLFAPYLAGAWFNSRWWTRRDPQPVAVGDGVWIGRVPSPRELRGGRFTGVVDLAAELGIARGDRDLAVIPVLDLTTPSKQALDDAATAIERLRARGPVLVCCALGYSRSACAVAAWLLATDRSANVAAALAKVRSARTQVVLGAPHVAALQTIRLHDHP